MNYERTTKLLLSTFFFVEVSCDGIGAAYSNDVSNVFRRAATGQVEDRFIQALDQGAKSRCVSETLNHLVANVSSIEVREDEDVSVAGNFGARCFVFANFRYESSISLEFAVEVEVDVAFFQDFNSMAYVVDGFASARTFGGVGKESDFRVEDLDRAASAFYTDASDISELFRRRIGDNAAVTEYEDTVIAILRSIGQENESGRYGLVARTGADDLKACADNFSRSRSSTGYAAVSFTESNEASCEEGVVVEHDFTSFFQGHAFLFTTFCEVSAKFVHTIVSFRVDDFDTGEIDLEFSSIFFDLFQFTYENDFSKTISQNAFSSFQYTTAVRFRKDDFFLCFGNAGFQIFCKSHLGTTPCKFLEISRNMSLC